MSNELIREFIGCDPESGRLTWLKDVGKGRHKRGDEVRRMHSDGYLCFGLGGKTYLAHRVVWLLTNGSWPTADVDHINGDRCDNRISNLRDVSRSVNLQNRKKPNRDNSSRFLGVSKNGNGFLARIKSAGKKLNLGTYETPQMAHAVYLDAKRRLHEGNTL